MKTKQAGKGLAGAVVILVALQLLVVPSGVCKWSINPSTNPYPICSHTSKSCQYCGCEKIDLKVLMHLHVFSTTE
jgi:hypothetical protein